MKTVCLLLLMASLAYAQQATKPSMQAESTGKCSPNILSNQGQVRFVCNTSVDDATAAKIVTLLNRILQQQGNGRGDAEVNNKLDEILGFLRRQAEAHEQRELPSQQIEAIKQALRTHPSKILILYAQQNEEAYRLAKQIGDVLADSGWTLIQPITGMVSFSTGGGPMYGMEVQYKGEKVEAAARVHYDASTPWGVLTGVLSHLFPEAVYLTPGPDFEPGLVHLQIYANPKSKEVTTAPAD